MSNETKFPNGLDAMLQKVINVADPSAPTDAVNLQTLQNYIAGLNWKEAVRVVATTNGALASAYENGDTVDGVVIATGDRILLAGQTSGAENGIYTVNASGAPTRATDADSTEDLISAIVPVEEGTAGANKWYQLLTDDVVVGTTAQVWSALSAGITYTGSNGVVLVGNDFRVQAADSSITVAAGGISTTRQQLGAIGRYSTDLPALSAGTPETINHGLGSADVQTQIRIASTGEVVGGLGEQVVDSNNLTVVSTDPRGSGYYRIVVEG
jgi:hypothetical protein